MGVQLSVIAAAICQAIAVLSAPLGAWALPTITGSPPLAGSIDFGDTTKLTITSGITAVAPSDGATGTFTLAAGMTAGPASVVWNGMQCARFTGAELMTYLGDMGLTAASNAMTIAIVFAPVDSSAGTLIEIGDKTQSNSKARASLGSDSSGHATAFDAGIYGDQHSISGSSAMTGAAHLIGFRSAAGQSNITLNIDGGANIVTTDGGTNNTDATFNAIAIGGSFASAVAQAMKAGLYMRAFIWKAALTDAQWSQFSAAAITRYKVGQLPVPTFTASSAPGGYYGADYSYTYAASDNPTFSVAVGTTLPPGLSLSSAGVLSGVMTGVGSYTFGVVAANSTGSTVVSQTIVSQAVTYVVTLPQAAIAGRTLRPYILGLASDGTTILEYRGAFSAVYSMNAGAGAGLVTVGTSTTYACTDSDVGKWPSVDVTLSNGTVIQSRRFTSTGVRMSNTTPVLGDGSSDGAYLQDSLGQTNDPHVIYAPTTIRSIGNGYWLDNEVAPGSYASYATVFGTGELGAYGPTYSIDLRIRNVGTPPVYARSGVTQPATGTRPAANTGTGIYVGADGFLYGPDNKAALLAGTNITHWDAIGLGLFNAKPTIIRTFTDFSQSAATNNALFNTQLAAKAVPMVAMVNGYGSTYGGVGSSGSSDAGLLTNMVDTWVAQASQWTTLLNPLGMANIANEWGGAGNWQARYTAEIPRMRTAGYTLPLVIDAPGSGQDWPTVKAAIPSMMTADPKKNLVFSIHIYGYFQRGELRAMFEDMKSLRATYGACFIIGEFGPGQVTRGDASHTTVEALEVMTLANEYKVSWIVWAWDDTPAATTDGGFAMCKLSGSYFTPNGYVTSNRSDLTEFGKQTVLDPSEGMVAIYNPLTAFG